MSSHYVDDPDKLKARLALALGPRFVERGRARTYRLQRVLREALAEDSVRLRARFESGTSLFRTPGDTLPLPVKRLVARLRRELVARTPARRRIPAAHLRHPYAVGLVWPLLQARLGAAQLPALYGGEAYRALVRALAGCHLTDTEMKETLAPVEDQSAEYRVGAWEYGRFSRRPAAGQVPGLERFAFYLLDPRDHMERGFADYKRRVHGSAPVRLAIWSFRALQIAALVAAATAVLWLLFRMPGGLMPGLTLLFAVGAAIPAWRLYRRPDMARLFGHVSERDLARARDAVEDVPARAPVPAEPGTKVEADEPKAPEAARATAVKPPSAPVSNAFWPVDIPAPIPVPAPFPGVSAASIPPRPAPALSTEDVVRAYMATPLGPIPFPVPRASAEPQKPPPPETPPSADDGPARIQTCADESGGAGGIFVLGWGMPIPVPNWMAASEPNSSPAPGQEARPAETDRAAAAEAAAHAGNMAKAVRESGVFHAPPLPPVLPSAAFWGVEGAGLHAGTPAPGSGDGPRRRDS